MGDILLVTGARALADSRLAEEWARGAIAQAFDQEQPAKLVTGDARGPDEWARREAVKRGVAIFGYTGRGEIVGRDARVVGRWTRDLPPDGDSHRTEWAAWYLHRDRVMVRQVVRRAREGATALVLALHAPWSTTQGTAFTVARAREAGLRIVECTAPEGVWPGWRREAVPHAR